MKPFPLVLIAAVTAAGAAGLGAYYANRAPGPPAPGLNAATIGHPPIHAHEALQLSPSTPASLHPGSFRLTSDPDEIFRRAFWRRPGLDDTILNAEGRQWTDPTNGDVLHWQWFIAVEAGPAFHAWLRESNPFSLRPVSSAAFRAAPSWFPTETNDLEVFQGGAGGSLILAYSRSGRKVFATAEGVGLSRAAATPRQEPRATADATATKSRGRLPDGPPPNPTSR